MDNGARDSLAFYAAAGATRAHAAADRVGYTTGALHFDASGSGTSGSAVQFALLGSRFAISSGDFRVK